MSDGLLIPAVARYSSRMKERRKDAAFQSGDEDGSDRGIESRDREPEYFVD